MTYTPFNGTKNYQPDARLTTMVNIAIARERPLLITGEAGTGKTQLAYAISEFLGLPLYRAQMTSTMEGEEICYTFDSVLRLTDSQLVSHGSSIDGRVISNPLCYVRYGAMGKAFCDEKRSVVLIDEIDKTESTVQDDLLRVLESYEFEVREANTVIKAHQKPIIVITSNGKRELSDAFLRRCYAHHIDFPAKEQLHKIVQIHYPQTNPLIQQHAINILYEFRSIGLEKSPATSEILDWIGALNDLNIIPPRTIHNKDEIPLIGLLLKRGMDLERVTEGNFQTRRNRDERVGV